MQSGLCYHVTYCEQAQQVIGDDPLDNYGTYGNPHRKLPNGTSYLLVVPVALNREG